MRTINLYMHTSLDNIITNLEQWMSYSDEMLEDAYEYYKTVDTIVVGGNTYSSMASIGKRLRLPRNPRLSDPSPKE